MARIVLGLGSSHSPQLSLKPDQWWKRAEADKQNTALWFRGKAYTFDQLLAARASQRFEQELGTDKAEARYAACWKAIGALGDTFAQVSPDVCIIIGDDQHELFTDDNMPAMGVYWGETIENAGLAAYSRVETPGLLEAASGHTPPDPTSYPGDPDLGRHVIKSLIQEGFDVAHSRKMPPGQYGTHSIGHAFGWVYRQIMHDEVIPNVPVFLNTYYPPNQPSMRRCYQLGKALGRAIDTWDSDQTVAVVASGGLTHFVIEEDLDQRVIKAMHEKNEELLTDAPPDWFQSGTSEIRNWAALAGAMEETDLSMRLLDYVPCYRSSAGTGCAMAFAEWR